MSKGKGTGSPAKRWAAALDMAQGIISETRDGDRSHKLFRAGVTVGHMADWPEATGPWKDDLVQHAVAYGANPDEARGHIERGIATGCQTPHDRGNTSADTLVYETFDEFVHRKRLSFTVLSLYGVTCERGSLRWPVPGAPVRRYRRLTTPSKIGWEATLNGLVLPLPYGMEQLTGGPDDPIYIVNGESGLWACRCGDVDAVSGARGEMAKLTAPQAAALIATGRPLRVVYDLDAAGEKGSIAVTRGLQDAGAPDVKALLLPADLGNKGDVGDLWARYAPDAAAFRAALDALPERVSATKPTAEAAQRTLDDIDSDDEPEERAPAKPPQPEEMARLAALRGSSVPPTLKRPYGYRIEVDGVWEESQKDDGKMTRVTQAPLMMIGRSVDRHSGQEYRTIAFRAAGEMNGKWKELEVERGKLLESRLLIKLTDYGLPIHSGQSGDCAKYLATSEEALIQSGIPETITTDEIGWQGQAMFLRGVHVHTTSPADCPRYRAPGDAGEAEQMVRRITTGGSRDVFYSDLWPEVDKLPTVKFMVACAMATALLHPLSLEPFVCDIAGMTSGGKTTALRLCVSMLGDHRLLRPWESTRASHERIRCAMIDHPMFLDDSRQVQDQALPPAVVYDIVNGRSKGRATPHGTQPSKETRSVVVSTGERPLSTMDSAGGLKARCLTVTTDPLGERTPETSELCTRLVAIGREHFGWLWHDLIGAVYGYDALGWEKVRARMIDFKRRRTEQAKRLGITSLVQTRHIGSIAVVDTAGWLIDLMLGRPLTLWVTEEIFTSILTHGQSADQPTLALRELLSWVAMNPARVMRTNARNETNTANAPSQGYIAHVNAATGHETILRAEALAQLKRAGYNAEEVVSGWKSRGWLHNDGDYKVMIRDVPGADGKIRERTVRGFRFLDAARIAVGNVAAEPPTLVQPAPLAPTGTDDDDADNPLAF